MHPLVLACYLCLHLAGISDLSGSGILERDTACDQCIPGIFNENEILSAFKTLGKSSGEVLTSHKMLREIVEQRLAKYESNAETPQKSKQESEYEKRIKLERFLSEQKQKIIEAKANQRKAAEEVERELTQTKRQLLEQQEKQNRDYQEYAKKLRESVKKYEIPTMKDTSSFTQILPNEVRLMAGQYLLSENGNYKATMQESGFLVITNEFRDGNVVEKVGLQRHYSSHTHYRPGPECHIIMQDDGNLVIYNKISNGKGEQVSWHTGTNSREGSGYYVKLGDDGELAMYNQEHRKIWTPTRRTLNGRNYDL